MDQELPATANLRPLFGDPDGVPAATGHIKGPAFRLERKPGAGLFPEVGESLEGCRLIAELGRGASGRAFLAQQMTLSDRPLVLKVTAGLRQEHLNLARLQHTHIMPLYWATKLHIENLYVLAMPYLARTTLSDL